MLRKILSFTFLNPKLVLLKSLRGRNFGGLQSSGAAVSHSILLLDTLHRLDLDSGWPADNFPARPLRDKVLNQIALIHASLIECTRQDRRPGQRGLSLQRVILLVMSFRLPAQLRAG